jgi:hypothetical protein
MVRRRSPVRPRCGARKFTRTWLSWLEHLLAKQEVAGSNPVVRSGLLKGSGLPPVSHAEPKPNQGGWRKWQPRTIQDRVSERT